MSHTHRMQEASTTPTHPAPQGEAGAANPAKTGAPTSDDRNRRAIAGAAVGIGSAAIVAALLYVNRKPSKLPPKPYERAD